MRMRISMSQQRAQPAATQRGQPTMKLVAIRLKQVSLNNAVERMTRADKHDAIAERMRRWFAAAEALTQYEAALTAAKSGVIS